MTVELSNVKVGRRRKHKTRRFVVHVEGDIYVDEDGESYDSETGGYVRITPETIVGVAVEEAGTPKRGDTYRRLGGFAGG